MRFRYLIPLFATSVLACGGLDSALEGAAPQDNRISVAVETGSLTIAQGADAAVGTTVTRLADYAGTVDIVVDDAPQGVSVQVAPGTTNGKATTASLTIHVSPEAKVGTYLLTIRARGTANNVAGTILSVTVVEAPAFTMSLSRGGVTLTPAGSVPVTVRLARTNLTAPIQLAASGPGAVQASFGTSLVSGDTATFTAIAVRGAAPGTYDLKITATAAGVAERSATLRITVSGDAMVVLADSSVSTAQGQSATTTAIVNRAETVGTVTLRAEGMPAGLTASVTARANDPRIYDVTFAATSSLAPGTYKVTLRATASGAADATTDIQVVVNAASIAVSLSATSISLFPGTNASVSAQVARTNYTGNVSVTVEGLPTGVTASVAQFSATTSSANVTIAAAANVAPGTYSATIRATPLDLGAAASKTAALEIVVRAAPTGTGNVILDWSKCTPPDWVAGQDGSNGTWTPLIGAQGVYRFSVNSTRGAFAWVEGGSTVNARYMTQAQLTAGAIEMCGSAPGTKFVTGTAAQHSLTGTEQFFWNLGGGIGISTVQLPNFTIQGIRNGTHDLVGWAQSNFAGARGYIRRDVDLPSGADLGTITITGTDGFAAVTSQITIQGQTVAGDALSYGMHLLTGAGCDDNFLYSLGGPTINANGSLNFTSAFNVMPQEQLRPSDFLYQTVTLARATVVRTSGVIGHNLQSRLNTVAPNFTVPAVTFPAGAYKRIAVAYGSDVSVRYNDLLTVSYSDGRSRFMNLYATKEYFGTANINLSMPDLSTVAGFPIAAALPNGATGSYTAQLTGADTPGVVCKEGNTNVSIKHLGSF
jgi:uncharacterized membrane protein